MLIGIGGDNTDQTALIEEVQKDINSHFQKEVQIRKAILQIEESISNINYKINEYEYELFLIEDQTKDSRVKELKDSIQKLNNDLEIENNKLSDRYNAQDNIIKNRIDIQLKISNLSKDPLGKNLIVSYKYYVSLLENMTLEEKRNSNQNNIKIKDFQIDKLTNQINIRDQLIHQALEELRKKNEKLKINENIKKVEEIKSNAYRLLPLLPARTKQPNSSQEIPNPQNTNSSNKDLNPKIRKHKQTSMSFKENPPANHYHKVNPSTIKRSNKNIPDLTQSILFILLIKVIWIIQDTKMQI